MISGHHLYLESLSYMQIIYKLYIMQEKRKRSNVTEHIYDQAFGIMLMEGHT
jgi:hypothetical protein